MGSRDTDGVYTLTPEQIHLFWSHVEKGGEDECWIWKSFVASSGLPTMNVQLPNGQRQRLLGNRIAYSLANPGWVPRLRPCPKNKRCVNPAHMTRLDPPVAILPEEAERIERYRRDLNNWMQKHRNQIRRGVRSGKELQGLSR